MTKKQIVISDLTGRQLTEYINISIEKTGYLIEFPEGNFTNRVIADVESDRVAEFIAKLKFQSAQPLPPMTKNIIVG
jgi:hypothetical protein